MKNKQKPFKKREVAEVFKTYPKEIRNKLMFLRQLIFDTASTMEEVGELEETLKWGEPSYLTTKSKSGSTVRISRKKSNQGQYGIYFNCQTSLVSTFRQMYPDEFTYEGNRAIIFNKNEVIPVNELRHCITLALTYRLNKKQKKLVI